MITGPATAAALHAGEQRAVNRADVLGAEDVRQERRNRGKPAAIHREHDKQRRLKQRPASPRRKAWNHQKQDELCDEEDQVGDCGGRCESDPEAHRKRPPALNTLISETTAAAWRGVR